MSNFLIRVDSGEVYQNDGPAEHLGFPFSPEHQTPTAYTTEGPLLVITYDGGAKRRIPLRHITDILEG